MTTVLQSLEEDGRGRVLVVDGGASMRCALLGDNIAEMAYKNGWSVSTGNPLPVYVIANETKAHKYCTRRGAQNVTDEACD